MKKIIVLAITLLMLVACGQANLTTTKGEADGYGGPIVAEVSVDDKGVIKKLTLTGEQETPTIGGEALPKLQEAILKAGKVDGVDAIAGATWTSNGVFNAVNKALGIEIEPDSGKADGGSTSTSNLKHGIAVVSTPRLGPGKDDKEVPVYSLNEVVAYAVVDNEGKLVDLEVDILEIITPNHDSPEDNRFAGWPGNSYNYDENSDGTVDGELVESDEEWVNRLTAYTTKREQGSAYKMNSGTWEQEMDIYEEWFKGKTASEIKDAFATLFSDVNGRPLNGKSENEEDVAKLAELTDDQKAQIDALAGATMSISDAHGDMIGAIVKAMENATAVSSDQDYSKVGLGVVVTPRLGPGKDDQEVPVYSFNVVVAGSLVDGQGKIVDSVVDIMEIITPNHDSAEDNVFTGWPGQSYNGDLDGDGKVEGVVDQDEDSFVSVAPAYRTKRMLGSAYKMNSGTWEQEMDIYEEFFKGMSANEIKEAFATLFSDVNGRPLNGKSENEKDVAKLAELTDDQKAQIDALAGATMSISDAHGDMIGALVESINNAK